MKKKTQKYWSLHHNDGWKEIRHQSFQEFDSIAEFANQYSYVENPKIIIGDEFDYIAIFPHKKFDRFMIYLQVSEYQTILFTESTPAMFELSQNLNLLIKSIFNTDQILQEILNEP